MKAIILGVLASFFFAFTFVLNRAMDLEGGSWIWSASLRYVFMVPLLWGIVAARGNVGNLFTVMSKNWKSWVLWSFVGFVLFYAPLSFASSFGPGWLIASTWQITIISGILLTPLFSQKTETSAGVTYMKARIPLQGLLMSLIILAGVVIMQLEHATLLGIKEVIGSVIPVLVASVAYPLGNRKMMEICDGQVDAFQRVLGMTIASLPFWFLLAGYELAVSGAPAMSQVIQCLIVALSSGLVATVLFFFATDIVKNDPQKLAAVEATQSGEVLFALAGELWFLSAPMPSLLSWLGMGLVIAGMILHSYVSHKPVKDTEKVHSSFS
jgi:drug/metabolite transporter (DMT)-like permease